MRTRHTISTLDLIVKLEVRLLSIQSQWEALARKRDLTDEELLKHRKVKRTLIELREVEL